MFRMMLVSIFYLILNSKNFMHTFQYFFRNHNNPNSFDFICFKIINKNFLQLCMIIIVEKKKDL